jgi:hypothetical protein
MRWPASWMSAPAAAVRRRVSERVSSRPPCARAAVLKFRPAVGCARADLPARRAPSRETPSAWPLSFASSPPSQPLPQPSSKGHAGRSSPSLASPAPAFRKLSALGRASTVSRQQQPSSRASDACTQQPPGSFPPSAALPHPTQLAPTSRSTRRHLTQNAQGQQEDRKGPSCVAAAVAMFELGGGSLANPSCSCHGNPAPVAVDKYYKVRRSPALERAP